jgi:phosphohistidine phosphatase
VRVVELLLVRHALASPAAPGTSDEARPLSAKGRREFVAVVAALSRAKVRLDRILHSPKRRAVETADLLARLLRKGGETVVTPSLAEPPDESLLREIAGERPALVGHQPWMGVLGGWLVVGSRGDAHRSPFARGGVARLAGEPRPGGMVLRDLWTPDLIRRLGR